VPLPIADSDDRILTVERTKVSARAGLQRSGECLCRSLMQMTDY
jgi:hypothetical protein